MDKKNDFWVLYWQKTKEDFLLIYSSYSDAKSSPKIWDFIVLTPKDEEWDKFLARVEEEIYDEDPIFRSQDKTLIAVHYARVAERELSERDKQKMFSYTYKVKLLLTFNNKNWEIESTTAVRKLPVVSYYARHLNKSEITYILNRENENWVALWCLSVWNEIYKEKWEIFFDISKLKDKRTMVFAQSWFWKTNLMKVLIYNMISKKDYGKLIFDLNGEYFLNWTRNYWLWAINDDNIKDNLVVFTDKKISDKYKNKFELWWKVEINMIDHLAVWDILNFWTGFSEVMKSFLLYLDEWQVWDFVRNINEYCNDPAQLHQKFPDFFWKESKDKNWNFKEDKSARWTIMAIRKRINHMIEEGKGLHSNNSKLVEKVFQSLKQWKTVIIDLSLKDSNDASIISTILVRKIFESNKENYTSDKEDEIINCVILVEEAQNVLSEEFVRSNANPFVRVAKEWRKFWIWLIAVTQRPSAISEEIRTQAENFFTFYMWNTDDIKALIRSNINYDWVIAKFIQNETIPWNLYMVSAWQAFVLPVRVFNFDELIEKQIHTDLKLYLDK